MGQLYCNPKQPFESMNGGYKRVCITRTLFVEFNAMKRTKPLSPELKPIGQRIRKNRRSMHYTQTDVAMQLGVDHATISRYERGEIDIPVSALLKIAEICGFEPKSCFRWESDGLDELQKMLEDCNKAASAQKQIPYVEDLPTKIELSERSKDAIMAYSLLESGSAVSQDVLMALREDIIISIEIEQDLGRDDLARGLALGSRLTSYTEKFKKPKRKQ